MTSSLVTRAPEHSTCITGLTNAHTIGTAQASITGSIRVTFTLHRAHRTRRFATTCNTQPLITIELIYTTTAQLSITRETTILNTFITLTA